MKNIDLGNFILEFEPEFIKLILKHEAHFDNEKLVKCYDLKTSIYGDKKIGVLVERTDPDANYSFDPLILLNNNQLLDCHVNWVVGVSEKFMDYEQLEFVKQMTKLKCAAVGTFEEAMQWVSNGFR